MITSNCAAKMKTLAVAVPDELLTKWPMPQDDLQTATDLPAVIALLADGGWFPDLVIVYQGVPDQFAAADVETFVGQVPLTRGIVVFGPWCESIGRTEQCWPIGWCVPLQHAPVRLRQELAAWQRDEPPLPPTASRDEVFVSSAVRTLLDSDCLLTGRSVRIESLDRPFGRFLKEAIQAMGGQLAVASARADIELLATTLIDDAVLHEVARLRAENPQAKLLVVTEMATPADVRKLTATGCDGVFSQLRFVEQFAATVQPT
ncbi:hypothetical protein GC176_17730 [bacterium]|nr:hypothetical protein [bacterium]